MPKRNPSRRRRTSRRPLEGIQLRTPNPPAQTVEPGTVRWRVHVGGKVHSAPYVTDGTVYVTGRGVWAVDGADGSVRWTNADAGLTGSPTAAGDTVYAAGYAPYWGTLLALDAADGRPRWRRRMGQYSFTQPLVANGLLHYVDGGRYLRTMDAATGRRRWRAKYQGKGWGTVSAPALADGILYAAAKDGTVWAFDAATGKVRWKETVYSQSPATPLLHDGTLYVGDGLGPHVRALDAATGAFRWRTLLQSVGSVRTTPAISGNTLYVGCQDHRLWALNATTGAIRWHVTTDGPVDSSPVVADGTVYFGSDDGHLWAISAENGRVRWKVKTGGPVKSPVVADGVLYVGSGDGYLYAIEASPDPNGP
ncbi:PQQ-binding-like beta-propeller repeat protein [Streptomyces sp. NBC_00038]|uniref:outer membrane protein assembly factor BamB family protein n=1 Tax=Streptomyces sp. NBC_00038 TaxID=2903615 RepID=UPI00224FEE59|nr:PQQ-binding-like beta-propeller repeat protein [Streptomyces sp. NBC_00038]MCX5560847.1 PQQ-binding-like beta-propeller repeat protein [Streptomyces sp. NBC_00038]